MRAQSVHGAGEDEFFHHPLVELLDVDPVAEVEQIPEGAVLIPRAENRIYGALAHPFHRAYAIDDVAIFVDAEPVATCVHVRGYDGQPHALALVH
ncbi:hypothetical protein D3C79_653370 [compost metagenome]